MANIDIKDGNPALSGVAKIVKVRGCSSPKACLNLNGTLIMSCLC